MKKMIMLALSVAAATPAFAISTYRAADFSCAELQAIVQEEGAANLTNFFGGGNVYFATSGSCTARTTHSHQVPSAGYISSSDKTFCLVGYTCQTVSER